MKRNVLLQLVFGLLVLTGDPAQGQGTCFYATVLSRTRVQLHVCDSIILHTNYYGLEFERRSAREEIYRTLPNSFCPIRFPTVSCSFIDSTVTPGVWYYRLRLIDLDGAISY